ncbi:MAG: hypothetical protein QW775_05520 [Ignisphaera sp.]|uniref:Uncharacterized protein n=1 Tax=Ignisphaera aggregans TaxID=334771 RepID=A0A7C4NK54_9CREN
MKFDPRILGFSLAIFGLVLLIIVVYLAYSAYSTYAPFLPKAKTLDEAITNTVYELLNLVLKLGFLGIILGCSGIALKYGISMIIELRKIEKGISPCTQH